MRTILESLRFIFRSILVNAVLSYRLLIAIRRALFRMNERFQSVVREATGATALFEIEEIQSLWSGYGSIVCYGLEGCDRDRVVVKHVRLPTGAQHPRGWNSDLSH